MDPTKVFTPKASIYARYRWSYAPEAIDIILAESGASAGSTLADIGAGTGILTRLFAGKVGWIFAIEPNPEMRRYAKSTLAGFPNLAVLDGRAEATTLPDNTVDLVTAAQAIEWFDPEPTRREFNRVLKPGGWLAILNNHGTNPTLGQAVEAIFPPQYSTEKWMPGRMKPHEFYFGDQPYRKYTLPLTGIKNTWEEFLGSLLTASFAPDLDSPEYPQFEEEARRIFQQFNQDGIIERQGVTELLLGQMGEGKS